MKIGFIGLGNMGSGMAANLLEHCRWHDYDLQVLDLNRAAMQLLTDNGALDGGSVAQMAGECDVLFTSLPSAIQVNQIAFGAEGILENASSGCTWFETSTNELAQWQQVLAAAPEGMTLIDAPVTGGSEGAAAGTLTMLLGVEDEVLKPFEDLLGSITKKAVRMGPSGAGYVTKLSQLHLNYLVAQGIGEALMLGAKAGLDLHTLSDVLSNSCAQSYVVDNYIPKVLDGSYDESFALGLATKDMRLITELGSHLDIELELANKVYATYQEAIQAYGPEVPHLNVVRLLEERTGQVLR
ncbi:NAD(P)-dependent oxidoreductase [Aliamphritea ceti]|uniref:NAD(P)-dependent oxidoreductase n=1 Tax=Aliamphritea ceti TaxID=1524258 RepID=UPI0021C33B86|nr:NAD(P)-dependent oxidoreductase [Aliamphritea ceti]